MKKILLGTLAAVMALSFAVSADAATAKVRVSDSVKAACKDQAAKKFSAIHFMKRREFANECMARHAKANNATRAVAKKPATTPTTTGQSPKQ
jgi:predicted outer membrane protein